MKFDIKSVTNKFNTMFNNWRTGICCNWNLRTHRRLYDDRKGTKGYMWVHHWLLLGLIFPALRPTDDFEMWNMDDPNTGTMPKKHLHKFYCGDWTDYVSFFDGTFGGAPIGLRWRTHIETGTKWKDHWEASISPKIRVDGDHTDGNMVSKTGPPRRRLGGGVNNV